MLSQKVKNVLEQIDLILAEGDQDSRQLWDILTALRGPDKYVSSAVKVATTAIIRKTVLPKTAEANFKNGIDGIYAIFRDDSAASVDVRSKLRNSNEDDLLAPYHFVYHAKEAFRTLELNWNAFNEPKTQE